MKRKKCTKCLIEKPMSEFHKDSTHSDGRKSRCKTCTVKIRFKYYKDNKEKILSHQKEWYKNHKDIALDRRKIHYNKNQKKIYLQCREYLIKNPWRKTFRYVNSRCNDPRQSGYERYGGVGIKNSMSASDFKRLWYRDKAYKMKAPHLHRKDSNGDYTIENCKYMEKHNHLSFHAKKQLGSKKPRRKKNR